MQSHLMMSCLLIFITSAQDYMQNMCSIFLTSIVEHQKRVNIQIVVLALVCIS